MIVEIEYHELKLRCQIVKVYPTFEEEYSELIGKFDIESIKLEDSEIDILDLVWNELEIIKELISEKL
jgi:hypothetical protein